MGLGESVEEEPVRTENPTRPSVLPTRQGAAHDFLCRIFFYGDSHVGKSSMISRFVNGTFDEDEPETIGYDFSVVSSEGYNCKYQIWDSGGKKVYRSIYLPSSDYASADAVVFVYDINNKETFEHITTTDKGWVSHLSIFPNSIPVFLVGNKVDLRPTSNTDKTNETDAGTGKVFVTTEEGRAVAESLQWSFLETSAFNNHNITELFTQISKVTLERIQGKPSPSPTTVTKEGS